MQSWQLEYQEVGASFRKCAAAFAQVPSIFAALNVLLFGMMGTLGFKMSHGTSAQMQPGLLTIMVSLLGVSMALGAIVIHRRLFKYWTVLLGIGASLDKDHGTRIYTTILAVDPEARIMKLRSYHVAHAVYTVFFVLWCGLFVYACGISVLHVPAVSVSL